MKYKLRAIWALLWSSGHWLVVTDKREEIIDVFGDNISFNSLCLIKKDLEEKIGDIIEQEVALNETNKILNKL